MAAVEHVFGVSATPVLSYVQRGAVDDTFVTALEADKQIVVYGSSKQGKTALVQRHLPYGDQIVVRLTPKTEIEDVYRASCDSLVLRFMRAQVLRLEMNLLLRSKQDSKPPFHFSVVSKQVAIQPIRITIKY